jgi:hypothetical protein
MPTGSSGWSLTLTALLTVPSSLVEDDTLNCFNLVGPNISTVWCRLSFTAIWLVVELEECSTFATAVQKGML